MIHLIAQINGKTVPDIKTAKLRDLFTDNTPIVTTDFVVSGEEGLPLETPNGQMLGYRYIGDGSTSEILSIDHHGPDSRMMRRVSSTNLALEFVRTWGTVDAATITHTDYDSVVASGVLTGLLPLQQEPLLGPAAIAADHTGEENVLADTLQAIQDTQSVEFSLTCLHTLLKKGEENLPPVAYEALQARRAQRAQLKSLIQAGAFKHRGAGIYVAYLNTRIDGELLPSLLADAVVIITVSPSQKSGDGSLIKTRLGIAAPEGMSLLNFGLPNWGGRWNAGSTSRYCGTLDPEEFVATVCSAVKRSNS